MSEFSIRKEIYILAPIEKVFDALTTSDEIVKYYPLLEVVSDWKVGAEVLYMGEIEGASFTDFGNIISLERPNEYSYSYWSDNHGTIRAPENHQTICYQLSEAANATTLVLQHYNLQSLDQYELMNNTVWEHLLNSLRIHVESGT